MPIDQKLRPCEESPQADLLRLRHAELEVLDPRIFLVLVAQAREPEYRAVASWLFRYGEEMYLGAKQPKALDNGHCFANSYHWRKMVARQTADFAYTEGGVTYPENNVVKCEGCFHGWNLYEGHVVDFTLGAEEEGIRYAGMAFHDEFLRFCAFMTGSGINLLNRFEVVGPYLENYGRERLQAKGPG